MSKDFVEVARMENKPDVYSGKECDEVGDHRWYINDIGDEHEGTFQEKPLIIDPKQFPPGTVVTIEVPQCPDCLMSAEVCDCGFDWKEWTRDKYC
jgi:hypothetical protein